MESRLIRFIFSLIVLIIITNNARASNNEQISLKIFISSSMPLEAIKKYFHDSRKYNATLILKGLPNGSVIELQRFASKITDNSNHKGNLIIDEEEFDKYKITRVPTIVLAYGDSFDKITGNINIKAALENFAKNGELKEQAKILLEIHE
jgi:type-F conjugative transfer system pilin assembly protein TrbC